MFNNDFYPTPSAIIKKMIGKIDRHPSFVLEPSAGKGDILDALKQLWESKRKRNFKVPQMRCMEIEPDLQATLAGKGYALLDTDFLAYAGLDKPDLIIMNPPFSNGATHLLKAIGLVFSGQIICLLNAETIKNPYTNERKVLVQRLEELGAEIEFIQNGFVNAERPTDVEVALVSIKIVQTVTNLFKGTSSAKDFEGHVDTNYEVSTGNGITELVAEYDAIIESGTKAILAHYETTRVHGFLNLVIGSGSDSNPYKISVCGSTTTERLQEDMNRFYQEVRITYWMKVLDLKEVRSRMTTKRLDEFSSKLQQDSVRDFTESNIRQLVLNIIDGYQQSVEEAVEALFDKFTISHSYSGGLHEKNIHMYSGWKTNCAYKVGKKVILPMYGSINSGAFYCNIMERWSLNWDIARQLGDMDIVMNNLDGGGEYLPMRAAIELALRQPTPQTKNIMSTYFCITVFKKNTIHLTFRDENILRRFNVVASKKKGWLPGNFGTASYDDLPLEAQHVVDSFEGKKSYTKHLGQALIPASPQMQLMAPVEPPQVEEDFDEPVVEQEPAAQSLPTEARPSNYDQIGQFDLFGLAA